MWMELTSSRGEKDILLFMISGTYSWQKKKNDVKFWKGKEGMQITQTGLCLGTKLLTTAVDHTPVYFFPFDLGFFKEQ